MTRFVSRASITLSITAILLLCATQRTWAVRVVRVKGESPGVQIERSLANQQWVAARDQALQRLRKNSHDGLVQFHAACALSQLDELDAAAQHLLEAVKAGYSDWHRIRREPLLEPIHGHARYQAILKARELADEMLGHFALDQWKRTHDPEIYLYITDGQRKLHFASALPEPELMRVRAALHQQMDHQTATLFEFPLKHFVFVAVPTGTDFDALVRNRKAHGVYQHATRRLVVHEAGRSLQHEITHVLHHNHMDAIEQIHPLWIQEGLATLYELFELHPDGGVLFPPNDRDALAIYLLNRDRLIPLAELMTMSDDDFRDRADLRYAQVRSIFRFLATQGHLAEWYRAYVNLYDLDSTGAKALEQAFDMRLEQIDRLWRDWIISPQTPPDDAGAAALLWHDDSGNSEPAN